MRRLLVLFLSMFGCLAWGAEVSPEQARSAVSAWLGRGDAPLGAKFAQREIKSLRTGGDGVGRPLYYLAELQGGGFVATSSDTELTPILAFSDAGEIKDFDKSPLKALLEEDQKLRHEVLAKGILKKTATRTTAASKVRADQMGHAAAWARLLADDAVSEKARQNSVSDIRVEKLLQTEWSQSEWGDRTSLETFNYYTPNNYVCGCVATAAAQIMKFWEYPTTSVASFANSSCSVDGYSQTRSTIAGAFDWGNMPLSYDQTRTPSETQRQAIGMLTYNMGVAVGMDWGYGGSGASTENIVSSFKSRYGYASGEFAYYWTASGTRLSGEAENAMYASLDARMPVSVSIGGSIGGHSIVADGYGYVGATRYTHLNMGWSGSDDLWYALMDDAISTGVGAFTTLKGIGFNIHPTERGEVISGRVRNASGNGVAGATVRLYSSSGTQVASTTSDAHGIYSFRVTNTGTYRMQAEASGQQSAQATAVLANRSSYNNCCNSWGNDLTLNAVASGLPDLAFAVPRSQNWSGAVFLAAEEGATSGQTVFDTTDTIRLFVGFGNNGTVQVPNAYKIRHEVLSDGQQVAQWVYSTVDHDLMEPGEVCWWGGYPWEGLANLAPGSYTYRVTLDSASNVTESDEDNNVCSYDFTVRGGAIVSLGVALDSDLSFTTGGSAEWFGQNETWFEGGTAARSGAIVHSQDSWLQTTFSGAGTLSFMWKVSSESGYDYLRIEIDGVLNESRLSGEVDWTPFTQELGAGNHTVRWIYSKDGSVDRGQDCGWVDAVVWQPSDGTFTVSFDPQGGSCAVATRTYRAGNQYGNLPRAVREGYLFAGWSTTPGGSEDINVALDVLPYSHTAYARWVQGAQSLEDALVAPHSAPLAFETGGADGWVVQARYTYDGRSAYSGVIGHDQESWIETVLTGPGTLEFKWLSGSEPNYDWLEVSLDGERVSRISDILVWEDFSLEIPAGTHTVRWTYSKDGSVSKGWDCGYLDYVVWTPEVVSQDVTVTFDGCGGSVSQSAYTYTLGNIYGTFPSATREGYAFEGWFTARDGGRLLTEDQDVDADVLTLYAHWAAIQELPIASAVNCPARVFTTGGDAEWFGQAVDTYDGDGAAQSGVIGDNQSTWMECAFDGEGLLSFWWKTSSEAGYDYLRVYVDGTVRAETSGLNGWSRQEISLTGAGRHVVRWVYSKDVSVSRGDDCARVDAIAFAAPEDPPPVVPGGTDGRYALCVGVNEYSTSYIPSYNWLSCCAVDANNVMSLLSLPRFGWGLDKIEVALDSQCTKAAIIAKINALAQVAQPGDEVVYYHSSHGGRYFGTSTYLCMYDDDFSDTDFAQAISVFRTGVKLIIVIDACHSGGMFKAAGLPGPDGLAPADFVAGVTRRLNEIRYDDLVMGRKGEAKIASTEIGWVTAADYDQYSWGGSAGSSFTITFCDCIRNGSCDQIANGGDGDGRITALEAAKYTQDYWSGRMIQGESMTPQYCNEGALHNFAFTVEAGGVEPEPLPNLRWTASSNWSAPLFLSSDPFATSGSTVFSAEDPIYMFAGFQNAGDGPTRGPVTVLHQLYGDWGLLAEWETQYSSIMPADPVAVTCWRGAQWDELSGLSAGHYRYVCTIDPYGAEAESDEGDNVSEYAFAVEAPTEVVVCFLGNGGEPYDAFYSYVVGEPYGWLPTPWRDGHRFTGWYTEDVCGLLVTEDTLVDETVTVLSAGWVRTEYPDLTVTSLRASRTEVRAQDSVELTFDVANVGQAPTEMPASVSLEAAFDGTTAFQVVDACSIPELSGYSVSGGQSFSVPGWLFDGHTHVRFRVVVDDGDEIEESDEENNVSSEIAVRVVSEPTECPWTSAQVVSEPQALPTVFDRMSVYVCGEPAPLGTKVAALDGDGSLRGLGEVVSADGVLTMFVRVSTGTVIRFKVWTPTDGVLDAPASADLTITMGAIIVGKELRVGEAENTLELAMPDNGWNLVSINVRPTDASPAAIFADVASGIDYVIGDQLWSPTVAGGYAWDLEIGKGYWVHTREAGLRVELSGAADPQKEMRLEAGWNVVGYNLLTAASASDALATAVASGNVRFVCTTGSTEIFPYSPLTMVPGKGYWIYVERPCTIAYDNVGDRCAPEQPKAAHPWSGQPTRSDGPMMPTVLDGMMVRVDGASAAKGDVLAVYRTSDDSLYAYGEVDGNSRVSVFMYAESRTEMRFKLWRSESGLANPVILEGTTYVIPDGHDPVTGLTAEFRTVSAEDFITVYPGEPTEIETGIIGATVYNLPKGLKYNTATGVISGTATEPTGPDGFLVYFVVPYGGREQLTIVVEPLPRLTVYLDSPHPGCTATGTGVFLVGKKVSLKATAPKGFVFAGWWTEEDEPLEGLVDYRTTSFSLQMPREDLNVYARFVPASEDLEPWIENLDYLEIDGPVTLPLEIWSQSLPTVAIKGLPKGLKFDAKRLEITGTPTVPGIYECVATLKNQTVKTGVSQNFTIRVPNLVNDVFCVGDYDFEPGEPFGAISLFDAMMDIRRADPTATLTVSGLPKGLVYDKNAFSITGVPTKPGAVTVTFTAKGKIIGTVLATATYTVLPYPELVVRIPEEVAEAGGKVTGSGNYLPGSKVTLKATAPKGYVFSGWYSEDENFNATYSEVQRKQNPFTYVAQGANPEIWAEFISARDDFCYVYGLFEGGSDFYETIDFLRPVDRGLGIESGSTLTSVKVTGLPAGLKFDAKGVRITGAPTKMGLFYVTVAAKNASGYQHSKVFCVNVGNLSVPNNGCLPGLPSGGTIDLALQFKTSDYDESSYLWSNITVGEYFSDDLYDDIYNAVADRYYWADIKSVKVTGLPAGLKFVESVVAVGPCVDALAPWRVEGVPTKPGVYTMKMAVTLDNGQKADYQYSFIVRDPGCAFVDVRTDYDGAKVSGTGVYPIGSTVKISATAPKDMVFVGWEVEGSELLADRRQASATLEVYGPTTAWADFVRKDEDDTVDIGILYHGDELPVDPYDGLPVWRYEGCDSVYVDVASYSMPKLTAKGLPPGCVLDAQWGDIWFKTLPKKPGTYVVTVSAANQSGAKADCRFKIVIPNLRSEVFDGLEYEEAYRLTAGATGELPGFEVWDGWKVTASGLPAGVKLEADGSWYNFAGVPTKAGTYTVTLTAKGYGGTEVATVTFVVDPLPDWLVGRFTGTVTSGEDVTALIAVDAAANGKISLTVTARDGTKKAYSVPAWSAIDGGEAYLNFYPPSCCSEDWIELMVRADASWYEESLSGGLAVDAGSGRYVTGEIRAQRNPFGKVGSEYENPEAHDIAATLASYGAMGAFAYPIEWGRYSLMAPNSFVGGYYLQPDIKLTVTADGVVKVAGKINGASVSGSTTLRIVEGIPQADFLVGPKGALYHLHVAFDLGACPSGAVSGFANQR